ncbi:hypothetical protein BASA61_009240 [Batrachochytrium salamandrivorans]|nr:hypothetical protein BASA61_009240 [Batrachochytrium salamandrivorans]
MTITRVTVIIQMNTKVLFAAAAAATMPTACTDPIHHPGHHDEHNISSQRPSSESNPDMESNALPATELDHLLHALDHTQQ